MVIRCQERETRDVWNKVTGSINVRRCKAISRGSWTNKSIPFGSSTVCPESLLWVYMLDWEVMRDKLTDRGGG